MRGKPKAKGLDLIPYALLLRSYAYNERDDCGASTVIPWTDQGSKAEGEGAIPRIPRQKVESC